MQSVRLQRILGVFAAILLVAGVFIGTFYDLDISKSFANVDDTFGNFLEIWAEPPSLLLVSFTFCLMCVYLFAQGGKKNKYLSVLCGISGVIAAYSTVFRTLRYYSETVAATFAAKAVVGVVSVLVCVLFIFISTRIKHETVRKMRYSMVLLIASALATLVIISALKSVWGRVRFRQLLSEDELDKFMIWFKPHGHASADGYKSFPSGHTSNATLMIAATYMIEDLKGKKAAFWARICAVLWIAVVMVSRVRCGAHFLTDVCMGALITTAIIFVCKKIFYKAAE